MSIRRLASAIGLSLVLLGLPTLALATTNVTYTVSGSEYAATSTTGSFAGVASSPDDFGTWQATVNHAPLPTNVNDSTAITGGSFSLNGLRRQVTGTFDSTRGTITLLTTSPCARQTFSVNGALTITSGAGGTASFSAVLTHYRTRLFGQCITYAATVRGQVAFSLN